MFFPLSFQIVPSIVSEIKYTIYGICCQANCSLQFSGISFQILTRFFEDYTPTGHRSKQLVMKNKLIEMV